jgi:hypothetical protein
MPAKKRKRAVKKKTNTPAADAQTTTKERTAEPPLPTAEWLAEMAARVWRLPPESLSLRHGGRDVGWSEAAEKALEAYMAAHRVLHRTRLNREVRAELAQIRREVEAQLSPDDMLLDLVEYRLACKMITGEQRRDRAEEWFEKLIWWLEAEGFWFHEESGEHEPPPDYAKQGHMDLDELCTYRRQYGRMRKMPKNVLAETMVMIGFKPRQRAEKRRER